MIITIPKLKQNSVSHYNQKEDYIQPIQICVSFNLNFCQGNFIKYVSRCHEKGGYLDLDKALDYLYWACQIIQNNNDVTITTKKYTVLKKLKHQKMKTEFYYYFGTFLNQHDKELKDLLNIFILAEDSAYNDIKNNDNIKKAYKKANEYSLKYFKKELKNNVLYESLNME